MLVTAAQPHWPPHDILGQEALTEACWSIFPFHAARVLAVAAKYHDNPAARCGA